MKTDKIQEDIIELMSEDDIFELQVEDDIIEIQDDDVIVNTSLMFSKILNERKSAA